MELQSVLTIVLFLGVFITRANGQGCGGSFTNTTGILRSPLYPDPYPNNTQCEYFISQPPGRWIILSFITFDLTGEFDFECAGDYLEIRDGNSTGSLVGQICGSYNYEPIVSRGNQLYLKFVTNNEGSRSGFVVNYTTVEAGCDETFTTPTGILSSYLYPERYPSNLLCEYFIEQPIGKRIVLSFTAFEVEVDGTDFDYNGACQYDYLEIRDGSSADSNLLGRYCGNQIFDPVISTANRMYLKFSTDYYYTGSGFMANYTAIEQDCGPPGSPDNGTVVTNDGTTYGNTARYTCNEGYTLEGFRTRTCRADGTWSYCEPVCNPTDDSTRSCATGNEFTRYKISMMILITMFYVLWAKFI